MLINGGLLTSTTVTHSSPRATLNFLFPNQLSDSKCKRQEHKNNEKRTMKTNNNTTSQTKWHSYALDAIKLENQAQQSKNTKRKRITKNTMTRFPWFPGKLNQSLLQDFMAVSCHAIPCIILVGSL